MTREKEVLRMALEAFKEINYDQAYSTEITAIKEALAQPEQEPVAWVSDREARMVWWNDKFTDIKQAPPNNTPLYTTPPQRTWVGLTDEDYDLLSDRWWKPNESEQALIDWVIERLKEKNT